MVKAIMRLRNPEILLVEDNPSDVSLTREALSEGNLAAHLHVAQDGAAALAFLRREGLHRDAPRPDLVLLDLNLPRIDGRRVLREIKSDDDLRRIPVIVLTTSTAAADIAESYDLHANCYISKPVGYDEFESIVRAIESFWLGTVTLPSD